MRILRPALFALLLLATAPVQAQMSGPPAGGPTGQFLGPPTGNAGDFLGVWTLTWEGPMGTNCPCRGTLTIVAGSNGDLRGSWKTDGTGATLSGPRRRTLLDLARRHGVPVFEDDFAGDLRYSGRATPAIKSLDDGGHVLYAGTFSKLLMPGLRVGYLVVDGPLRSRLIEAKQVTDLGTSLLLQRALDRFVTVGRYQSNLRRTTRLYRERRDALRAALAEHVPEATFTVPAGGLFCWVGLPRGVRSDELLVAARQRGVDLAPGSRFFLNPEDGAGFVRLNFAVAPPHRIATGIARLAAAIG